MPSKDSKQSQTDGTNVVKLPSKTPKKKDGKKVRQPITFSLILTYVILGLLSIVLIVGVVVPSLGSSQSSSSVQFGTYNGEPIEFSQGNYFYRQYQNQAQQNSGSGEAAAYQIWRGAFEQTVFHTAIEQMADDAGIIVAESTLNDAIIDSGVYNKDGKFDIATYEEASVESKNLVKKEISDSIPTQIIVSDLQSVLDSDGELDYILSIGDASKAFDFVILDASIYPDDATRAFALSNPAPFTLIDISIISLDDEQTAQSIREQIVNGEITFEQAAEENSLDGFAEEGGKAGVFYYHEIETNFTDTEQVNELFSTEVAQVSDVYASPNGYALYRVEQAPFFPDYNDSDVLDDVRAYIQANNPDVTQSYVAEKGEQLLSMVNDSSMSFSEAADELGLTVNSVDLTPPNVGETSYLMGFSYTDQTGYLQAVSTDVDIMKELYALKEGEVSSLIASGDSSIVVQVTSEGEMDEQTRDYISMIYPYVNQQSIQQDLINTIFTADDYEDNFLTVYLDKIMGITSQQ